MFSFLFPPPEPRAQRFPLIFTPSGSNGYPHLAAGSEAAPPHSGSPPPHLSRPAGGSDPGRHVAQQPPSEAAFATQ